MEYLQYLDSLESKLRSSFDIYRDHAINELKFDLYGRFYMTTERYLLTKKAKIFGIENNEHILIKKVDFLNRSLFDEFKKNILKAIDDIVDPHPEHMSSIVTGVIVVDNNMGSIDQGILDDVVNYKFHKGFSFGLRGWVDVRLLIVSLKDGIVISNKKGKEVEQVYKIS